MQLFWPSACPQSIVVQGFQGFYANMQIFSFKVYNVLKYIYIIKGFMGVIFAKCIRPNFTRKEGSKTDFVDIKSVVDKHGTFHIYPNWLVGRSRDLMVRGKSFYAIWDESASLWSTDEFKLIDQVESKLWDKYDEIKKEYPDNEIVTSTLKDFKNKSYVEYRHYISCLPDSVRTLDNRLTFADQEVRREDYASKRLPYSLNDGPCDAWDEIVGTLYEPGEREKIEWAIGSVVAGDAKDIQKFMVLYGDAGSGKSTILNIIQKLFIGYYTTFEAKAIGSSNNAFSTDAFRSNPLVAIQHDGDLSRIEDNSKLNSIVSHEEMQLNEKYKPSYTARINCFLFMATNKPVKITDSKSGIIRRLIDVHPSGVKIPSGRYQILMERIDFELGAIAQHCLDVYRKCGKHYYDQYIPFDMMMKTDVFFNFVEDSFEEFKSEDGVALKRAYAKYRQYCDDTSVPFKLPMYKFREELKDYFAEFKPYIYVDGKQIRSYYSGFLTSKFQQEKETKENRGPGYSLSLDSSESIFDEFAKDYPAQYAGFEDKPVSKWDRVTTKLSDIDTSKVHYVMVPENHIVIDFDLKNEKGEKDAELNLAAASKWPPTYAEFSKGGAGVHLHYIYDADSSLLSTVFAPGIEIKRFNGNSSLRRRLSKCNNLPIAHISSGLPLREVKKVVDFDRIKSEKGLRAMLEKNLRKEYHGATKPSVDFIYKILEDAYNSDLVYDVTDMRPRILAFAANSTNHAQYCIGLVSKMHFMSDISKANVPVAPDYASDELVFYDVEVFPNLFLVNWKYAGEDKKCVRMINPTPEQVGELFKMKLVGFNCRRYDNHIMYARYLGYTNLQLFDLSQKIVATDKKSENKNCFFREAYNLSYTDVYDFASAMHKQSLKKWEIELGIHHQELGYRWDEPVPEELWEKVAEYCDNDVRSTEAVFNHLKGDWAARQILAKLSGLTPNDSTNSHSTRIIFGNVREPQSAFNYRNLAEPVKSIDEGTRQYLERHSPMDLESGFVPTIRDNNDVYEKSVLPYFPGYEFKRGKSTYRGFEVGEGGFVYSEPGMYWNVALLDAASMHPTSMENECLFGPEFTERFSGIKDARIAIKHKDRDALAGILDGTLLPFYDEAINDGVFSLDDLSNALKTVINSVYGLTSASFTNAFRDKRNIDNIVAKRGALFMIDLMYEVKARGFTVAHIKTDSIKIPNATPEIIQFVVDFGKKYGYIFEHESTYERMCLVNKAVYIAKGKSGKHAGEWIPTGAQFAQPYVLKTLFTHEPIDFRDYCETRAVKTALYLDMNEANPEEHNLQFVGRVGSFCPMKPGAGGGLLVVERGGKYDSAPNALGYRWMESEMVQTLGLQDQIDPGFHRNLVDEAYKAISEFGDAEQFIHGEPEDDNIPPWCDVRVDCKTCEKKDSCTANPYIPF